MSLVRWKPRTPLVRLPVPLEPEAPPAAMLASLQWHADRSGKAFTMPNGYTVRPREKKRRGKKKPVPGWWLRGA